MAVPSPTADDTERLMQACVAKATRILMLVEAPLGSWGEMTDLGVASVRPDYQIRELLFGLHYQPEWDLDAVLEGATAEMVIRQGLQTDPASFPAERLPDVERALAAARSWIKLDLVGLGVA